jgi:hypothetical protein
VVTIFIRHDDASSLTKTKRPHDISHFGCGTTRYPDGLDNRFAIVPCLAIGFRRTETYRPIVRMDPCWVHARMVWVEYERPLVHPAYKINSETYSIDIKLKHDGISISQYIPRRLFGTFKQFNKQTIQSRSEADVMWKAPSY